MFVVECAKLATLRPSIVRAYQEQQDSLEIEFNCTDGVQRCSQLALEACSDHFSRQFEAKERFGNRLQFNYDKDDAKYSKQCVKHFLDALHNIKLEIKNLTDLMELIKFIQYEAKCDSHFEKQLLALLCETLEKAELSVQTKLLVCMVVNTFDDIEGRFEKVRNFETITLYSSLFSKTQHQTRLVPLRLI